MAKFQGLKSDLDVLQTSYTAFDQQDDVVDDLVDDDPLGACGGGSRLRVLEDSDDDEAPPTQFSTDTSQKRPIQPGSGFQNPDADTPFGHDNVMIQVPESNKSKWSHIDDLDSFFLKVYEYHQKHGFTVMMLQELLELIQFIFIVLFMVFLVEWVDYPLLFKDKPGVDYSKGKIHLGQVINVTSFSEMAFLTKWFIMVSVVFWLTRLLVVVYHVFQFWDIKCFFNSALQISDQDLDSITWWDVQKRLLAAQKEHMMCIHKEELTELDVYHRILRFTNYLVAMVNKSILPLRFSVPIIGDRVFLSSGLKFNLELILFRSPWAPFNQWNLRDEYKRVAKRKELAESLSNKILILGCINLILMPVILLWQILYSFFNYAEVIKREPGSLGVRKWGLFGKLYLRHLNELDHELNARLSWAYKPATYYMDIFVSPLFTVIAKNIAFVSGSVLAVLILLTVWDEDVLNVEHVLTIMTVLGATVAGARVFIPDENLVFCPEKTLAQVISHIHYFPVDWKNKAHTYKVMDELGLLFPYTAVFLVDELLSPIITPLILIFHIRWKSQEMVDFFRNFTVDVVGVGDVCSFAQMDVRRHGHPYWQADTNNIVHSGHSGQGMTESLAKTNHYTQGEDGKTEMSLVHFTLTNPGWKPSHDNERYLVGLRTCAKEDLQQLSVLQEDPMSSQLLTSNPMYDSVSALPQNLQASYRQQFMRTPNDGARNGSAIYPGRGDLMGGGEMGGFVGVTRDGGTMPHNLLDGPPSPPPPPNYPSQLNAQDSTMPQLRGGLSRHPGPLGSTNSTTSSFLLQASSRYHLHQQQQSSILGGGLPPPPSTTSFLPQPHHHNANQHQIEYPGIEYTAADMSMSALYLHNIQHRHATARHQPTLGQTTGYRFHGGTRHGEKEPLLSEENS